MRDENKTEEQPTDVAELQRRVTELEILETECQRAQEMLRKSEKRFQNIFDHSNDAIFVIDAVANEILDVNSKACTMLGYSREELLSTPISAIHPDEMPKLLAFAKSVSRNGQGWTDELRCLTKAGRFLPAEISASPIDMSGRLCTIALIRDISKRKQAEEELHRASQRMKGDLETAAKIQESLLPQVPSTFFYLMRRR